jgi:[protein-PII] uridylyltransferase
MSFLRELHSRTTAILQGDIPHDADPSQFRRRLMRELKHEQTSEEEVERFLKSLQANYLFSTPIDLVRLHMRFEKKARAGQPTIELFHKPELGSTDVTVCCPDAPGLLSKILGVFYALDLSVHGIRASTTQTDQPVALDTFTVSFSGKPVPQATCRQLSSSMTRVLLGEIDVQDLLRQKGKDPERTQQYYQFTYHEGEPGILEFRTPRGRGMAYRLSNLIAKGWNIISARVGQWAGRGAAAFYIVGESDRSISSNEVNQALSRQV